MTMDVFLLVFLLHTRTSTSVSGYLMLSTSIADRSSEITEMPGDISHSELNIFTPTADQATVLPAALAWLTAAGLYHGALNFDSTTDDLIAGASLFAYPIGIPVATLLTEFHLVFLYRDRVIALNTMDHQAVYAYEEIIPLVSRLAVADHPPC
jgi:hypothetical protein